MDSPSLVTKEDFLNHAKEDRENFLSIHTKLDKIAADHPTNGELALMISSVAKDVVEVKVQTTKTNGRVTALEVGSLRNEGRGDGMKAMWGWIIAAISIVIMVINFILPHIK